MHPYRIIVRTYMCSDSLSMRPDYQNTLTLKYSDTDDTPRDPLQGSFTCQLFVTDKGFVYVVPMKSNDEVLQYIKHFSKDVGKPEPIISDSAR